MKILVNYNLLSLVSLFVISLSYSDVYSEDNILHPLRVGDRIIQVEVADTVERARRGLTGRENLSEDQGMLFVVPGPEEKTYFLWMEDVYIPLSVGFFNVERELLEVQEMYPDSRLVVTPNRRMHISSRPCKYALEVNAGWFEANGIQIGTKLTLD